MGYETGGLAKFLTVLPWDSNYTLTLHGTKNFIIKQIISPFPFRFSTLLQDDQIIEYTVKVSAQ